MADILIKQNLVAIDVTEKSVQLLNLVCQQRCIEINAVHMVGTPNVVLTLKNLATGKVKKYSISLSDLALSLATEAFANS